MSANLSGWSVTGIILFVAVCLALRVVVFLASCALADAGEPRLGKATVLALVVMAVCAPVCWWLLIFLEARIPGPENAMIGPAHIVAGLLICVVYWVLPAVIYKFLLPAPWKKGALVAGLEVLLGSLLTALVVGVLLVILAGIQVAKKPAQATTPALIETRYLLNDT